MANPRFQFQHSVDQVFDLIPGGQHIRRQVGHLLHDRDQSVEDAINSGLRKTMSKAAAGNASIFNAAAGWVDVSTQIEFDIEKTSASSRFEIDAVWSGKCTVAALVLSGGVWIQPKDLSVAATDNLLATYPFVVGQLDSMSVHSNLGYQLPPNLYTLRLRGLISAGNFGWDPDLYSSMRVTESLY